MLSKDITEKTLQDLIDNSVMEQKTLEYKSSISIASDLDKKEFLADVSSFANASGGDIIYGDKIDRDIILLTEIIIENYDIKVEQTLKPWFDSIWNACGFSSSKNYNEKGEWSPER